MPGFARGRSFACAGLGAAALVAASAPAQVNETPKKEKVYFFSPYTLTNKLEPAFASRVRAEGYDFEALRRGDDPKTATLERFVALAKLAKDAAQRDYAIFVIATHGSPHTFGVEGFASMEAAEAKLADYAKSREFAKKWGASACRFGNYVTVAVPRSRDPEEKGGLSLTSQGIRELFGQTDGNKSLVILVACCSSALQENHEPFKNDHLVTFSTPGEGLVDVHKAGTALCDVMLALSGVPKGNRRAIGDALTIGTATASGMKLQRGDGKLTLAPMVVAAGPDVAPIGGLIPGSVVFDTKMDTSDPNSVLAVDPLVDWCRLGFGPKTWNADGTILSFTVGGAPGAPGPISVVHVTPSKATSANNGAELVGNSLGFAAGAAPTPEDPWFRRDPLEQIDRSQARCLFGINGYDGVTEALLGAAANPYRWCIVCDGLGWPKGPPGVPEEEQDVPRLLGEDLGPITSAWGDALGHLVLALLPGGDIVIDATGAPPSFSFVQAGAYYGHAVFTPDAGQVGGAFTVSYAATDGEGGSVAQDVTYHVVDRADSVEVVRVPSVERGAPGDELRLEMTVENDGTTFLRDLAVTADAFTGPGVIDPSRVTVDPPSIPHLPPGRFAIVTVTVETIPGDAAGTYAGALRLEGTTSRGAFEHVEALELRLTHAPEISGPPGPFQTSAGATLVVPLVMSDADGDELEAFIELAPHHLDLEQRGNDVTITWSPQAKETGVQTVPVWVSDGVELGAYDLEVDVDGPINVNAMPAQDGYVPADSLMLLAAYLNANDEPAQLFEKIEVYADGFGGPLLHSSEISLGILAPGGEIERTIAVSPFAFPHTSLAVRLTARTVHGAGVFLDTVELLAPDCNASGTLDGEETAAGAAPDVNGNGVPDECECDEHVLLGNGLEAGTKGWTVESDPSLIAGAWEAVAPNGTSAGGVPAAPGADATEAPGSIAFVTQNGPPGGAAEDDDVDGGPARLVSPPIMIDDPGATAISYARWLFCDDEDGDGADALVVEISDDVGASWAPVESVGGTAGTWRRAHVRVGDYLAAAGTVHLRFSTSDPGDDSITEAGIDDLLVTRWTCPEPPCPGDTDGDGSVGFLDLLAVLSSWGPCAGCPGDADGDGGVGFLDLLAVLSAWGPCR
jgi:hypothetical protein